MGPLRAHADDPYDGQGQSGEADNYGTPVTSGDGGAVKLGAT